MADEIAKLRVVLETETAKYQKGLEQVNKKLGRFEARQKKSLNGIKQQWNLLRNVAGGYLSLQLVRGIIRQADAMTELNQRIKTATAATGDFAQVNARLFEISQQNGVALAESVGLFQNLAIAAKSLGKSNDDVLELTRTVQQLGVLGGSSTEALNNALRQFSQAMAGGVVRAEEFNSIIENTPYIADRIAEAMGYSVGELRNLVVQGKVLSKDVFEALQRQSAAVNQEFENMPLTIARASEQLGNAWDQFISKANEATGLTDKIAQSMSNLARALGNDEVDNAQDELNRKLEERAILLNALENASWYNQGTIETQLENIERDIDLQEQKVELLKEQARLQSIAPVTVSASQRDTLTTLGTTSVTATHKTGSVSGNIAGPTDPFAAANATASYAKAQMATLRPFFEQLRSEVQAEQARMAEITQLEDFLQSPMERLQAQQDARAQILENARQDDLISEQRYQELKTGLMEKHEQQRAQLIAQQRSIQLQNASALFGELAGLSEAFAGEQSGIYKTMFAVSKAFAIADSIIKIQQGIANAASLPFPGNLAAMGSVAAATGSIVSSISAVNFSGARATGGPVGAGKTYLVGERGPELFTATTAGNITANNKLGGNTEVNVQVVEDASRAGQVSQDGDNVTLYVAAVKAELRRELQDGSGVWKEAQQRYGLTRRGF